MCAAVVAVTTGEPAGIGPDVALSLFREPVGQSVVVLADPSVLCARARMLGHDFDPGRYADRDGDGPLLLPMDAPCHVVPGKPDPANASHVLAQIDRAVDGCLSGEFAAMVTGPVNKRVLSVDAEIFTGHTEYLRRRVGVVDTTMMFVNSRLRLGLVTTHLPLSQVARSINTELVLAKIEMVAAGLATWFELPAPVIKVVGLNPHAGEGGMLGREETEIIAPAVGRARDLGHLVEGPVSADTALVPGLSGKTDAVLSMFHDQCLPAAKALDFDGTVNVTLGLPFIRTSVDHGTAESIAGSGKASPANLRSAVELAVTLCEAREQASEAS